MSMTLTDFIIWSPNLTFWSSEVTLLNMISVKFLYEDDGLIEYVDKLLIQNIVYPEEILNDCPLDVMTQGSSYLIKNLIN